MEKRLEPIVDMIRKIKVCIFVEEGRVPDAVECLGEIQTVYSNFLALQTFQITVNLLTTTLLKGFYSTCGL